jgi:hypothetical protein
VVCRGDKESDAARVHTECCRDGIRPNDHHARGARTSWTCQGIQMSHDGPRVDSSCIQRDGYSCSGEQVRGYRNYKRAQSMTTPQGQPEECWPEKYADCPQHRFPTPSPTSKIRRQRLDLSCSEQIEHTDRYRGGGNIDQDV